MIAGIDIGADGGICVIDRDTGALVASTPLPIHFRKGKKEVDIPKTVRWLAQFGDKPMLAIEEPLRFAPSAQALRSLAIGFGLLVGMAKALDFPLLTVDVLDWHSEMLGKKRLPKGMSKIMALRRAKELSPQTDWNQRRARSTRVHDGIIDAFLIAHFCKKKI